MLTDDDWAEIWRLYFDLYDHRRVDKFSWLDETTQLRIAKLVDAKLREKAKAEEPSK